MVIEFSVENKVTVFCPACWPRLFDMQRVDTPFFVWHRCTKSDCRHSLRLNRVRDWYLIGLYEGSILDPFKEDENRGIPVYFGTQWSRVSGPSG